MTRRKLSRGAFFAQQKSDAWAHAQDPERAAREREERAAIKAQRFAREVRETADSLIEGRGLTNALAWCEHCSIRSHDGLWPAVCAEVKRRAAQPQP